MSRYLTSVILSISIFQFCVCDISVSKAVQHDFYSKMWTVQDSDQGSCSRESIPSEWTQSNLLLHLTNPCRYNKQMRPPSYGPNIIEAKVFVYFLKATSGATLQFQAQILLELKWNDSRLNFENYNTSIDALHSEKYLMNSIWLPHVFLSNERDSLVMGFLRKDDFIIIHRNGLVIFTTRLKSRVSCQMNVGKFPFDEQKCSLIMESWRYDSVELMLKWEETQPVILQGGVNLTEFRLVTWETSSTFKYQYSSTDFKSDPNSSFNGSDNHAANHNYSSLVLSFTLAREYGFYIMDYYIPSILIVILSWLSFWLTPDALPARINLGSSTMLTFLQLGWTSAETPKLSQFQYNNIWEVVCTLFIFLTLVEFAFVNTIHRSGFHQVPIKKPTSKYILKSSLASPPKPPRSRVRRTSSCPSSPEIRRRFQEFSKKPQHKVIEELCASDLPSQLKSRLEEEKNKMEIIDEDKPLRRRKVSIRLKEPLRLDEINKNSKDGRGEEKNKPPSPLPNQSPVPKRRKYSIMSPRRYSIMPQFTMSNHEIAKWIDQKSRIVFPTAFLIFCLTYWSFLWV